MRIAVLCDIHGNLTAFEAVLADLRTLAVLTSGRARRRWKNPETVHLRRISEGTQLCCRLRIERWCL